MGVVVVLWAAAFWQSWECRGLFSDGSVYFLGMIVDGGTIVVDSDDPRSHAVLVTQLPVLLAMKLGVRDLHWLARLYSLALFGVPTALYTLALVRASRDASILAATLAAIATIFMTTSFLIVGEHNTAYACAIFAAVWLSTASGLRVWDGFVLLLVAVLAARCYPHYVYLGPLLGLMAFWTMARAAIRPWLVTVLYGLATAFFFAGGLIAANSLLEMAAAGEQRAYLVAVVGESAHFRFNVQLGLLLAAMACLAVWGALRPDDLRGGWPYLAAGILVLLVAASPVLVFVDTLVSPPYSSTQQSSRTMAGALTASFVVFVWFLGSGHRPGLRVLSILREPPVAQRLVVMAGAMIVATMPWNVLLTGLYSRYLEVVRMTIRGQAGPIAIDDAIFERHPRLLHRDIAPSSLSLIMRTSPTDGILVDTHRNPADWADPAAPPDLGRFVWRD